MYQEIEYNEILSSSMKVYAKERPSIPAVKPRRTEITIPGRDGSLYRYEDAYDPTEITVAFNFVSNEMEWMAKWRQVQNWLGSRNSKLLFGDDGEVFYKIAYVDLSEIERTTARIGNFTATFVTRDGLCYLQSGEKEYPIADVRFNPYGISKPIYKITGEGNCILKVNGKSMKANVGQNLTIDTDRMLAYREDGSVQNTAVSGNYEELYLKKGTNSISISSGFALKIIPNWRYTP